MARGDTDQDLLVRRLIRLGVDREEIARQTGLTADELRQRIAELWRRSRVDSEFGDPTPAEIAERAAIERQNWSEHEYYRRSIGLPPDWTPPMCSVRGSSDW